MSKSDNLNRLEEEKEPAEEKEPSTSNADVETNVFSSEAKLPWSRRISAGIVFLMFLIKGFKIGGFQMSELSFAVAVVCFSLLSLPVNVMKIFSKFFGKGA